MAEKDKEFNQKFGEEFVDQTLSTPSEDLAESLAPTKAPKSKAKLRLRALNGAPVFKTQVLCVDEHGHGYLVDKAVAPQNSKEAKEFSSDDTTIESLYTWNKEIEAMLPDRSALVSAVRLSLYRAGALQSGDLRRNEVRRNALKTAFPYEIKESSEE